MSLDGLRGAGVEASASGVVLGRQSTGAGAFEEVPAYTLRPCDGTDGALLNNIPRAIVSSSTLGAPVSGTLRLDAIHLPAGFLVTSIAYHAGTTAAVNPTAQWFALFDRLRVNLAVTGDDTTTAWAANAQKRLALATPYRVLRSGLYYVGLCVVADTVPTLAGVAGIATGPRNLSYIAGGASTASLTDPASCPATAGTITASANAPYIELF
jgi:hypothetical protein